MKVIDKIKKLFVKIFPVEDITSKVSAIGVSVFDRNKEFIEIRLKYKKGFDLFVLAHEIGHVVDDKYRYTDDAEYFADIFAAIYIMELIEQHAKHVDEPVEELLEFFSNYNLSIFNTRFLFHVINNNDNKELYDYARKKLNATKGIVDIIMLLFSYTYMNMLLKGESDYMTMEELYKKANEMIDEILIDNGDILTIKINDRIKYDIDINNITAPIVKAFYEFNRLAIRGIDVY